MLSASQLSAGSHKINLFRDSQSHTCLINSYCRPKIRETDKTRKLNATHNRSALDVLIFALFVAMVCSQIAMTRMYLNFNERISTTASKFRPNNTSEPLFCFVFLSYVSFLFYLFHHLFFFSFLCNEQNVFPWLYPSLYNSVTFYIDLFLCKHTVKLQMLTNQLIDFTLHYNGQQR